MYASIFRVVVLFPIILFASLAYGQSLEMFGIDILAATRSKVTGAVLEHGAEKLPSKDSLIDRYDGNAIFQGARIKVGFTAEDALERIVFQFDSGSWFTDVLNFDDLKQILVEKYGQPVATPVENRNSDFEEELKWEKN